MITLEWWHILLVSAVWLASFLLAFTVGWFVGHIQADGVPEIGCLENEA